MSSFLHYLEVQVSIITSKKLKKEDKIQTQNVNKTPQNTKPTKNNKRKIQ